MRRQDLFHKEQIQGRRLVQLSLPLPSSSLPSSSSSLSLSSSLSNRQNRQAEEIGKECRVPHIDRQQRQRQLNVLMTRHGTARHYNTRHYNTTQYDTMQHNTSYVIKTYRSSSINFRKHGDRSILFYFVAFAFVIRLWIRQCKL